MSFDRCIRAALAGGLIDDDTAQLYLDTYGEHEAALRGSMTPHEASSEAGRMTFAEIEGDTAERRRQTFLSLAARQDISARLDSYKSYITGKPNPYLGADGVYDRLLPNRNGLAVEQQREFWRGQAHANMDDAFRAYRMDLVGRQGRRADESNIVAEAFGKDTGDAEAKAIAQGWIKTRDMLRAAFNRFGGHIGEIADYGFPQVHAQKLVNAVPFNEWRDFMISVPGGLRLIGKDGKTLLETTKAGTPGVRFEKALREMYDNIVTNGWASKEEATSRNPNSSSLANRHAQHRFVNFNEPEGWLAYQNRFGDGNVFDTMMHHIETMSRDIAHMQVLGPNPHATVQWLKNELERRAAMTRNRGDRIKARVAAYKLDELYGVFSGASNTPVHQWIAEVEGDVRNVVSSALLGSATLTAQPTDMNFSRMTRAMNGLPQMRALGAYAKLLNPASAEDRMLAIRNGLTAEGYAHTLHDSARMMDQIYGHEWSKLLIDRALVYNGLTPHTQAARWAYGWTAQGALAGFAKKTWSELDLKFRDGLERYRIGEPEWNDIRATPLYDNRGATFLRPGDIMARTDLPQGRALDLGQRIADWMMTETEFAVPSSSLMGRAMGHGLTRPGTIPSVFLGSPLMFKTFALTYLLSHGRRMLAQTSWRKSAQYGASLFVMSTIAGAIALQMREIANGRNPRDMTDPKFYGAAAATGGGLGVFGDFLYSSANSGNADIYRTLAGPLAGLVGDVKRLLLDQPMAAYEAKDQRRGLSGLSNNTITFAKRYMPGGGTWYARAALERLVFDRIQEATDPNWKKRVPRVESWYKKQTGQDYWWRRGDLTPREAPQASAAIGVK